VFHAVAHDGGPQALLMRATRSSRVSTLVRYTYYDACDVIYYVIAVRARRMVRTFVLPYVGNGSKSDPCSYELFCLESHVLSFPKVLQIPPESPCIYRVSQEECARLRESVP
jgi:hypothetical protein